MTRTVAELWAMWQPRAKVDVYPFDFAPYEAVERAMASLTSVLDREAWAAAFSAEAAPYEQRAREAAARDDRAAARQYYLQAYALYRMARFPCMNSPGKQAAYLKSQECFLNARRLDEAPVERVEMPFRGRPGEGDRVVGYLRLPPGQPRPPILVAWAGIDTFKEDRIQTTDPYFARGMATMTIDMPGTGDAPLPGSEDAERMWDAVFDWIATRPDLDANRIGLWGGSTGGYWATKVAHTHRDRVAAVLSQGGPAHFAFEADWIARAQEGEYPFELAETLACAFGRSTYDEWVAYAPRLSLLDQGILDRPCAPLLCVNGVDDTIFPIQDYYLLLEHGDPKSARFFQGGHMGRGDDHSQAATVPHMVSWLCAKLGLGH